MNKRRPLRWAQAGLVGLLLVAAPACDDPSVDLELATPAPTGRQAFYTDTLTVRSSTVLVDSVPSSSTAYLLVGRYVDAQLGIIEAQSYLQPGLTTAFAPAAGYVYDSLALTLTPDIYRYGDTTRAQQLEVRRLQQPFQASKTYYTKDALTYETATLGQRTFRASELSGLCIRLSDALGHELWQAGLGGRLSSGDELRALLPGLALLPGAADDAAVVRWSPTATLHLYYHDPLDPSTALNADFTFGGTGNARFFHLQADRRNTSLASLSQPRQALSSTLTANQSFIEAGLGLCTKLEFPYLLNFRDIGSSFVFNSSELKLEVVQNTATRYLPVPTPLLPQLTNRANQLGSLFMVTSTTSVTMPATTAVSPRTGLDQTTYTLDCSTYIESVIAGTIANDGILLSAETAGPTVGRVVLGSAAHTAHPLKMSAYYTRLGK